MATGRNNDLSERKVVQLAAAISVNAMKTIAEGYLDIAPETVKTAEENRGDAEAFNREIIRYWRNRNPGPDQVEVILNNLFKIRLLVHIEPKFSA